MDAKDLRNEPALGAHTNDGSTKYAQSGPPPHASGNKPYHDIGPNPLAKVDVPAARPCAIIGPDRVVQPHSVTDLHSIKKAPVEPWPCSDNLYRHLPEYPHKTTDYHPPRNISPRQTFQENMPRIMVPPIYASKANEDHNLKNSKLPSEVKYCEVPYTISPMSEPKTIKSSDMPVPSNNLAFAQTVPSQGWPGSGVNMRPLRPYGAPELYQYPEYPSCTGSRPVSMIRPHRNVHEDAPQLYPERFYHEANARFKPYPTTKERHSQLRYDYMSNYPNSFHPPPAFPPHKYDLQKSIPPHPYSVYPQLPLKYLDRRMPAPTLERYRRSPNLQPNLPTPFGNQNIPPTYGPVPGNCLQNRTYPYSPDPNTKTMIQNKFYFDNNNSRKYYPAAENMYINDINRPPNIKNDGVYPPYPSINIHSLPPHHMYRKEALMKNYEQHIHYRNLDYSANMNSLPRLPYQFSPQTIAISPCDSNISNDTTTLGIGQEDCGYVSQSSSTSVRSIETAVNRMSNDIFRRQDIRYQNSPLLAKSGQKLDSTESSKDKKGLNVRQFLQMWNEGDDEVNDSNKEPTLQKDSSKTLGHYETLYNQEQLYVLDLVNVPNHELGKYDHIQKISKLPENIKGYNNIEILNQFEKLVETPNMNNFSLVHPQPQKSNLHVQSKNSIMKQGIEMLPRPISPLDVEAKISQSVIHKEVRCNFEIKPCSPQMLNVDVATPVQNVLGERLIEKVVNPVMPKVPIIQRIDDISIDRSLRNSPKVPSCKMVNNQYPSPSITESKTNYSIQDLESNSGVCLSSLPRLDNDIELSFPEINQQFINANKIESPTVPFMRDLLDPDNDNRPLSRDRIQKPFNMDQVTSGSESDKEFVKLSKYRKQKRSTSVSKEIENKASPTVTMSLNRTDSVIIKNPDNIKSQEEYLSNQALNSVNLVHENCTEIDYKENYTDGTNNNYGDTAIDFRLKKDTDKQTNSTNEIISASDSLLSNFVTERNMSAEFSHLNSPSITQAESNPISMPNLNSMSASTLDDITCSDEINEREISTDLKYINKEINISLESKIKNDHICEGQQHVQEHDTVITHMKQNKSIIDTSSLTELVNEKTITQKKLPTSSLEFTEISKNTNVPNIDLGFDDSTLSNDDEDRFQNDSSVEDSTSISNSKNITDQNCKDKNDGTISCETKQGAESHKVLNSADTVTSELLSSNLPEDNGHVCINKQLNENLKDKSDDACELIQGSESNEIVVHLNLSNIDMENKIPVHESESNMSVRERYQEIKSCNGDHIHNSDKTNNIEENYKSTCSTKSSHIMKVVTQEEKVVKNEITNNNLDESSEMDCDANKICFSDKNTSEISSTTQFTTSILSPQLETSETDDDTVTVNNSDTDTLHNQEEADSKISDDDALEDKCDGSLIEVSGSDVHRFDCNRYKTGCYIRKELFSPRFQKLLIYNEGLCSDMTYEKENCTEICEINDGKDNIMNPEENDIISDENTEEDQHNTIENLITENSDAPKLEIELDESKSNEAQIKDEETKEGEVEYINETIYVEPEAAQNNFVESLLVLTEDQIDENNGPIENNDIQINVELNDIFNRKSLIPENLSKSHCPIRRSRTLKRSLSESAAYHPTESFKGGDFDSDFIFCNKRKKVIDSKIFVESEMIAQNLNSFIQNNRRNSISTVYNDNVSFCIVIDNDCIITNENEETQKICFTQVTDDCLSTICSEEEADKTELTEVISYEEENSEYNNDIVLHNLGDKSIEETWIEDVACIETVFSDDIAEDIIISAPMSPKNSETSDDEIDNSESVFIHNVNEHSDKIKCIYGDQMSDDDAQLVEKLYRTPQMDVNKALIDSESHLTDESDRYYDKDSLEKILSGSTSPGIYSATADEEVTDNSTLSLSHSDHNDDIHGNKENLHVVDLFPKHSNDPETYPTLNLPTELNTKLPKDIESYEYHSASVNSCESSCDNHVPYNRNENKIHYTISSSPEVTSTTPEERSTGILLKIKNYKGTKISEINAMGAEHRNMSAVNNDLTTAYRYPRPLITKAAQKYIPPLKETLRDLKVKLRLPQQSLYKLKQLKKSKEEPKIITSHTRNKIESLNQDKPKKVKPKFEDVLKSIDEIQFKMHKEKSKKVKQAIPKVIIKKNENGAHYASTQKDEQFNPDLTGRKWQPWVFLEKSNFIDKMAVKQKFKAVYNHRKKTYVLAENFRKYKSISSAKFVITHPNESMSTGKLKYTIRLKHN